MTDPTADFITTALNAHGIFFKKAVRQLLQGKPISIDRRKARIVGEEYPVSYLEGASIDLLAELDVSYARLIMPIECKRGYAAKKQWIFFRDPDDSAMFMYGIFGKEMRFASAFNYDGFAKNICVEGVEIDSGTGNPYKAASPDRLWKAAFQVCKGNDGFLYQELEEREKTPGFAGKPMVVLPLLVTTAPLFICEVPAGSVDLLSGNLKTNAQMSEVDWLVLKHPFTPSAALGGKALPVGRDGYVDPTQRGFLLKEGISMVRASALLDFMQFAYRAADSFAHALHGCQML